MPALTRILLLMVMVLQNGSLKTSAESLHKAASAHLTSTMHATRMLAEQGAQQDVPTGKTPRKRNWDYINEWDLTANRDVIIKSSRQRGLSKVNREISTLPPLHVKSSPDAMIYVTAKPIVEPARPEVSSPSPLTVSMSSSSSSSTPPLPHPILDYRKLGVNKTAGALTERPTNILTTRGSRRVK